MDNNLRSYIRMIPKAELHLHIEGTFEPEMMVTIANRNGLKLPYDSVEDIRNAYNFNNLQDFLDIYYAGANVLQTKQDFFDLTYAYLKKVHTQNVVHAEIFFDPQTHTERGVPFDIVIRGIHDALEQGRSDFGISYRLIMCFLRHLDEEDAITTLKQAHPYKHLIYGVGLDSSELGHPPSKFSHVFRMAKEEGYTTVAHAGEEGPASYIWEALNLLNISRLDHGNRCLDDEELVNALAARQIALTLCPLSNQKLKVQADLKGHPLKRMMHEGLLVTINSDDPSYFGGYINENYEAVAEHLGLSRHDIYSLAVNSFKASFLPQDQKDALIAKVHDFNSAYPDF